MMPTPDHKELIRDSFVEVAELSGPIALLFYGRLFELAPEVRPLFRQDIAVQGRKLMDMLAVFVNHLDDFEALRPTLRALGQRHAAYGVIARHYDVVTNALIWAFGLALEDEFTPEHRTAWRALIECVSAEMKEGAAQLSAETGLDL